MGNWFDTEQEPPFSGRKLRNLQSNKLANLFGPLNGYYYHKQDKAKVISNHEKNTSYEVSVIFKYTGIELENIQKEVDIHNPAPIDDVDDDNDDDDDDNKDDSKHNVDLESLKEFQHTKFEWVYIINNDPKNKPYRKIGDTSYELPSQYEEIRDFLAKNDPIPPQFLSKAKMAGKVMESLIDSRIRDMKYLKARIITKNVSDNKIAVYHPALLVSDPKEAFGKRRGDRGWIIHLIKTAKEIMTETQDTETKDNEDEEMEIECRVILRSELDAQNWEYKKSKLQDLKLQNGMTDIGHWCLKYEMTNNYKYERYSTDCIQFMKELCNEFNIVYDAKAWSNLPYEMGKVGDKICGSLSL